MAPEYLVRGQLTEKADVYSYGVLVLEIICGRKSHAFVEDSSLLQSVRFKSHPIQFKNGSFETNLSFHFKLFGMILWESLIFLVSGLATLQDKQVA